VPLEWRVLACRGVVWYGDVFSDVAWFDVAWCGMVSTMTWCIVAWAGVTWRGVSWRDIDYKMPQHGLVWMAYCCVALYGVMWWDVIWGTYVTGHKSRVCREEVRSDDIRQLTEFMVQICGGSVWGWKCGTQIIKPKSAFTKKFPFSGSAFVVKTKKRFTRRGILPQCWPVTTLCQAS
jgi:hypothetical protein